MSSPILPDITLTKGMPAALDCERFVLGSVLMRGTECFTEVSTVLDSSDFAIEKHRRIYGAMARLNEKNEAIDHVTISHELMRTDELESVDGLSYVISLTDGMPMIPNIETYARIIREKSCRRRVAVLCQQTMNRALSDDEDAADIVGSMVASAQSIESGGEPDWQSATDIIRDFPGGWQALISPASREVQAGIPYPWPRVQQVVCGLQKGELTILAGRPGMGKSALAMQIANYAATRNFSVAYISLEMTGASLIRRQVAQGAHVDSNKMRLGYLNADERARLIYTRGAVEKLPLHIESRQRRGRTVTSILASLRHLRARNAVDLVVIDHFHLVDGPEREERIKYNRIADALQRGARDMEVPFLVLAQLSRKCEEERREPGLPDLKECGKIEENADVVMFIHRPEMYVHNRDREDLRGVADLIIAKQRDGATGKAGLIFISQQTRFESRSEDIQ